MPAVLRFLSGVRASERSSRCSYGFSKQRKQLLHPAPAEMDEPNWDSASSQPWYSFIAFVVVRTYFTVSPGSCLS